MRLHYLVWFCKASNMVQYNMGIYSDNLPIYMYACLQYAFVDSFQI